MFGGWGGLHVALLKFTLHVYKPISGQIVRILEHHLHSLQTLITTFEIVTSSSLYGRKFTWVFTILLLVWNPVGTKIGFYKCCVQIIRFIHVVQLLCAKIQIGGSLDSLTCANWEQRGNWSLGMYKREMKKAGEEMCLWFLCFITDVVVFSQDLINQGREKVVEATNSVAAARIQPLEDIISAIVSAVDNPGLRSGVENIKHYQRYCYCKWSSS